MDRRTRLFVFPGGLLEITDYGEEDNDEGQGFYLESGLQGSLPRRVPGAAVVNHDLSPVEPAAAETCAKVLRLLRDLP
ncbi:hypothetical protein [Nocardia sp. NPDC052112]|uniref:hypothetical protein n=1 Tax=Nocardia sp. NPDC052112 TaxID=3155646 RepID=UPI003449611F